MSDCISVTASSNWPSLRTALLEIKDSYSEDAKVFVAFLEENGKELTYDSLCSYATWLDQPHNGTRWSAATYNKRLAAAKNRVRLLFERTEMANDLTKRWELEAALKVLKPKKINTVSVQRDRVLSETEINDLVAHLHDGVIPGGSRVGWIVSFIAATGTRISETLNILLTDIKRKADHYEIRLVGKGNKERKVMVNKSLIDSIRAEFSSGTYLFDHGGKKYNPQYVTNQIRIAGQIVLGKRISAHTLRHSFATNTLARTNNLKGVSKYLGHASTSITADLYVHNDLSWGDLTG